MRKALVGLVQIEPTQPKRKKKASKKRAGKKKGKGEAMKASEVTSKEARLACGCIGTRSSATGPKPVFWINRGCGAGGQDHQPGSRRILEPDDEVTPL